MDKILIAYATWTGATRTVAEAVAETLAAGGDLKVEVLRAKKVRDLAPYKAVVAGISVHMGKLPREIRRFIHRHRRALSRIPTAYFVVCLTMSEDTPENRRKTLGYLEPLHTSAPDLKPLDIGLFGGAILTDTREYRRLFLGLKLIAKSVARETADRRDWKAVRAWAQSIRSALLQHECR